MEKVKTIDLGNIYVVPEGAANPRTDYVGGWGSVRVTQLGLFFRGKPTPGYEFWVCPYSGGQYRLTSAKDIDVGDTAVDFYWHEDGSPKRV